MIMGKYGFSKATSQAKEAARDLHLETFQHDNECFDVVFPDNVVVDKLEPSLYIYLVNKEYVFMQRNNVLSYVDKKEDWELYDRFRDRLLNKPSKADDPTIPLI